jgi:Zn-dependent protease/predicted transcriptional regulator
MFGKSIKLFTLFGFKVEIDLSWFILAALVVWTLARGLFPHYYEDLSSASYWWMAVVGTIGLFLSIIVHEFMHSLVARKGGLPIRGIKLFIFGGVADMEEQPPEAKTEFFMAIAGPIASIVLGAFFYGISIFGKNLGWTLPIVGVLTYLGIINWVLAGFNLLPAFPLDGGRVLRSILWYFRKDLRWSTRIASRIGIAFSVVFILFGIVQFFSGNFIGGVWIFMIGMFLQGASRMSYKQLVIRQSLEGEDIERFMNTQPVTVSSDVTIEDLVENYIYKYHYKMFPVVDNGKVKGCVTTNDVKQIPRREWSGRQVKDISIACSRENSVTPDTDVMKVLSRMRRNNNSRMLVVEKDKLVGIITLKDIMEFLSLKLDLESYQKQ